MWALPRAPAAQECPLAQAPQPAAHLGPGHWRSARAAHGCLPAVALRACLHCCCCSRGCCARHGGCTASRCLRAASSSQSNSPLGRACLCSQHACSPCAAAVPAIQIRRGVAMKWGGEGAGASRMSTRLRCSKSNAHGGCGQGWGDPRAYKWGPSVLSPNWPCVELVSLQSRQQSAVEPTHLALGSGHSSCASRKVLRIAALEFARAHGEAAPSEGSKQEQGCLGAPRVVGSRPLDQNSH